MKKLSSYLLNEDSHNRRILKEEIYPETKKAIVYHLTGSPWNEKIFYPELSSKKNKEVGLDFTRTPDYLFHTPIEELLSSEKLSEINNLRSRSIGEEGYNDFLGTPQGKAHFIASSLFKDIYTGGSSFKAGQGAAYGKGLYSCYELNPKIAARYGDVILKFEVDISNFLIFVEDIAKDIHGENYRLEDQFVSILERKGFNIDLVEDVNTPVGEVMSNYLQTLSEYSDGTGDNGMAATSFGVSGSTTGTRTAPVASKSLYGFSKLTRNKVLLRNLVDGIIFFGSGDGPVCLIYRPETSYNYHPVGVGFFKNDGNPVIVDDIERLRGFKGISLNKKARISKMQAQRKGTDAYNKKFMHDTFEKGYIDSLQNLALDQDIGYKKYIESVNERYEEIIIPKPLIERVIAKRFENSLSTVQKWASFIHHMFKIASNCIPMMIDPTVKLINLIGPGIQAINAEDFVKYHRVFIQVSDYINKRGVSKEAFSAIRQSYKELVFDEKFLKIINHNTDDDKIIDDLRYLVVPNSFESYFPYHSEGYKDLLAVNNIVLELFVDGYTDTQSLPKYINNCEGVAQGISLSQESDEQFMKEYLDGHDFAKDSKSLTDLIDSNINYKTILYEGLVDQGILSATVDPNTDSIMFPIDLRAISEWSYALDTGCHITYTMMDSGNNNLMYKSAVEKYKSTSYNVSYSAIIKVMAEEGLTKVNNNTIAQMEVHDDLYISNIIIDYPHDYMPKSWDEIKRLMIDFEITSSGEVIKTAIKEKTDNLMSCMEQDIEDNEFAAYLYSLINFRTLI